MLCTGVYDERANEKGAISRFLSDTSANASRSILYLYEHMNARRCKISFLYVMGRREQENRKRKAAAKSCQSLDTWVSKVPRPEPSDADNDIAVCDDSPAETTTSDLSQSTTVLQRDRMEIILIFAMSTSLDPLLCSSVLAP